MTTEKMTIHEALSELKVLNSRISKEINFSTFVVVNKHSNTKIAGQSISEFKSGVLAQYTKINDLIKRRSAIKKAVVRSNAITDIVINGETMTVAEAIEYKNVGIDFLSSLCEKLAQEYNLSIRTLVTTNGDTLEKDANDYVIRLFGAKDTDVDNSVIEAQKKTYIENNTIDLIDPVGAEKEVKKITEYIDAFKSKVDAALSVSNATTTIEITY